MSMVQMGHRVRRSSAGAGLIAACLTLAAGATTALAQPATVLYVDDDAPAGGNGLAWGSAFNKLEVALEAAKTAPKPVDVRVAGGTYSRVPFVANTPAFFVPSEVTVLGAYRGLAAGGSPDDRDFSLFASTLTQAGTWKSVIETDELGGTTLDGLVVIPAGDKPRGVYIRGQGAVLRHMKTNGFPINGGHLDIDATDVVFEDCQFEGLGYSSTFLIKANTIDMRQCTFKSSSDQTGVMLDVNEGVVSDCIFEANTDHGVCLSMELGAGVVFERNKLNGQGMTDPGMGIWIMADCPLVDCEFKAGSTYGTSWGCLDIRTVLMQNSKLTMKTFSGVAKLSGLYRGCVITTNAYVFGEGLVTKDATFESCTILVGGTHNGWTKYPLVADDTTFRDCSLTTSFTQTPPPGLISGTNVTLVRSTLAASTVTALAVDVENLIWIGGRMASATTTGPRLINLTGDVLLANVVIDGNTVNNKDATSLIDLPANASVINCTIANNQVINVTNPSQATAGLRSTGAGGGPIELFNTIVYGNRVANASNLQTQQLAISPASNIRYSTIEGWDGSLGGVGNFGDDPQFASGTLEPISGSTSVDSGDASSLPTDAFDIDQDGDVREPLPLDVTGKPRRLDDPATPDTGPGSAPMVDRGAYEFDAPICKPDCDANGSLDIDDFVCFQTLFAIQDPAADCDTNGQLSIDDFVCFQAGYAVGC